MSRDVTSPSSIRDGI